MERLSRCTNADVVRSIDQLQTARLGTCSRFQIIHHKHGSRSWSQNDGILQYYKYETIFKLSSFFKLSAKHINNDINKSYLVRFNGLNFIPLG